jgi:rhodanese-related sulfurtransferase
MMITLTRILIVLVLATAAGWIYAVAIFRLELIPDVAKLEQFRKDHEVSAEQLIKHAERLGLVIDARKRDEFLKGHLNAPMIANVAPNEAAEKFDLLRVFEGQDVVLYCTGENCEMAEDVMKEIEDLGMNFASMRIYFPGWDGILKNNLPIATGEAPDHMAAMLDGTSGDGMNDGADDEADPALDESGEGETPDESGAAEATP